MSKQPKAAMWRYDVHDVRRASFQIDGTFHLFRRTQEAGKFEHRHEDYKGNVIESVLNPKSTFEEWVALRVAGILHGLYSEVPS